MRKQSGITLLLGFGVYGWLEFEALIFVGNIVGGFLSFTGIFLTAFIGIYLIRRLNRRVFMEWQSDLHKNKLGLSKLAEGLSILLGGFLLVVPGYLTDLIGFIFMLPLIRTILGSVIIANFADFRIFSDLPIYIANPLYYWSDENNRYNGYGNGWYIRYRYPL